MCVNINKAFDVLCSQSLCEVVVSSCLREVQSKSSFALRVSSCHFGIFAVPGNLSLAIKIVGKLLP